MELGQVLTQQYVMNAGEARSVLTYLTNGLTPDDLNWQARPGHHSIWHHTWHMFLSHDHHFAYAMETTPVWDQGKWRDRIDLTPMARAFDYAGNAYDGWIPRFVIGDVPDDLVDELKAPSLPAFLQYVDDMIGKTAGVLRNASEAQLTRPIKFYGGNDIPAFTLATGFSHCNRHIGMVEEIVGQIRPGPEAT
jgi:hypothetical protein